MSFAIDLKEHGPDLKQAYESVVSSDPETTWAVFNYTAANNVLKPGASGAGDLDDFVDAFDDAKVQYGLAQVEFNSINKIVLVGWVGENVPTRQRMVFNAHMSAVAKQFPGHHVQITARSSDELSPSIVLDRVAAAAGSKYAAATKPAPSTKPAYVTAKDGAREEDWGDAQDVEERELHSGNGSGYKSSVRDELERLRKGQKGPAHATEKRAPPPKAVEKDEEADEEEEDEDAEVDLKKDLKQDIKKDRKKASQKESNKHEDEDEDEDEDKQKFGGISGLNSGTSYKPVGKIDLKAIREAGKNSKFADARVEKIESSYKPVGKVDLKAIREQARKEKELKARKEDGDAPTPARKSPAPKLASKREESGESDEEAEEKKPAPRLSSPSSTRSRPTADADGADDDEPKLGSLSDRMKAFQASIGAAKPKFDSSSRPGPSKSSSTRSSTNKSTSAPSQGKLSSSATSSSRKQDEEDDEEDDEPISVAAQLAKARLGHQKEDSPSLPSRGSQRDEKSSAPKAEDKDEGAKGNVSTFAARFAAKSPSNGEESKGASHRAVPAAEAAAEEESEEEDDAPPPPRRSNGAPTKSAEPKRDEPETQTGEAEASGNGLTGVVQFEHEKEDDDEISLKVGEKITEIQEVDENWYLGRNSAGDVGLFPAEFVEIEGKGASSKSAPKAAPSEDSDAPSSAGKVAIAQYDYEAGDDDELEFEENEKITEIEFPSEDWWSGKNSKGKIGLFPASYVTLQ